MAITAFALKICQELCLNADANGFVARPMKEEKLSAAIEHNIYGRLGAEIAIT
jgi:hypothetical protein